MSEYNGWTNYETWRVNLELVDGLTLEDLGYDSPEDAEHVGTSLEMYVCDLLEMETNCDGFMRDLGWRFLAPVNWTEIAEHLISDHLSWSGGAR